MDAGRWSVFAVVALAGCSATPAASVEEGAAATHAAPVPSVADTPAHAGPARAAMASASASPDAPALASPDAPARARLDAWFLDGERRLLTAGALSAEKSEAILGSDKDFAQAVSQIERDAASRPEAQDLTRLYRAAVSRVMGGDGTLVSFACGYSLCVGEIRSRSADDFNAWSEAVGMDKSTPIYSLATAPMTWGQGQQGGRFVFSVDPAANGISAY
ncbi:TPA: hypothetical protein QEL15_003535 [Stenotrophomonas maltophilia]|nr:hypothetical protein [Stenotrophomonas maltophilia]